MRKMKNNLDEMQEMNALKIAERSFWIMFFGLVIAILFGEGEIALKSAVVFFGFIFILCYIVLSVMLIVWKKKNRELEEDEEE